MYSEMLWHLLLAVPSAGEASDGAFQLRVIRRLRPCAVVVSVRDLHQVFLLAAAVRVEVEHHGRRHELVAQSGYKYSGASDCADLLSALVLYNKIFEISDC